MANECVISTIAFDTLTTTANGYIGNVTGTTSFTLPILDLSSFDSIRMTTRVTTRATAAGDILVIYLQCRGQDDIWTDRAATKSFLGNATLPQGHVNDIQQFGTLSDTEEGQMPYGYSGVAHITAGTVVNGQFPGRYRNTVAGSEGTESSWRLWFDQTKATAPNFVGTIWLTGNPIML